MKTTFNYLTTILTIGAVALMSTTASAGGGGKGKKSGSNNGGFSIGFGGGSGGSHSNDKFGVYLGGGNNHGNYNNNYNQSSCRSGGGYGYGGVYNNGSGYNPNGQPFGQAFEPFHSTYICQPGDNFYTVSMKEYATSATQAYIAKFNGLALNAALLPGQRLVLPSISANGQLRPARRPAAEGDVTPVAGFPTNQVTQNFKTNNLASTLQASTAKPVEVALPKVAVGSTLVLDGQVFGEERGVARLRVGGLALPVEVIEWTNTSAKVRLPIVELTSATKADIEVLRADGSVAATTGVELNPAANRLAQGN